MLTEATQEVFKNFVPPCARHWLCYHASAKPSGVAGRKARKSVSGGCFKTSTLCQQTWLGVLAKGQEKTNVFFKCSIPEEFITRQDRGTLGRGDEVATSPTWIPPILQKCHERSV